MGGRFPVNLCIDTSTNPMKITPRIRPLRKDDYAAWTPLWDGYNAFYGREGATALDPAQRGQGIGRALIQGVYAAAKEAGIVRVYWQTHVTNTAGRTLYDKVARHLGFIVYSHDD